MKLRGNKIPRFFVKYSHWERRKLRCFFFSALGFGIAGVLWVCIFSKILQKWWYHISLDFRKKWNMFWVFIFVTDCAAALIFPNTGHSITF